VSERAERVPAGRQANGHGSDGKAGARTVREAVFEVMRHFGMTTIFGNPGSTEIPFLTGLPEDISFVLALHEGSVVGMATGYALATGQPAFVNLHTAPGLGNAVNAIAGARDNRVPLVIAVGQQDRNQSALAPFLTGRALERIAGEYPVWSNHPARAQDVPWALARAWHEARTRRGPALVVVPMGDWQEPADEDIVVAAPARLLQGPSVNAADITELADLIADSERPTLVVGSGLDSAEGWGAAVALAERLDCPVWQDPFASRAGFPQDHPLFMGHLHFTRRALREALAPNDLVVTAGTWPFRLYIYEPGPLVAAGTRVAVITDDPEEAHRSPADLGLLASPAVACRALAEQIPQRSGNTPEPLRRPAAPAPLAAGEPMSVAHVVSALAERLPPEAVLVEESPSSRAELMARLPIRSPLGFVSVANGALGFGLSGSIGMRMGFPDRPVVALLGDGSSMYAIQSLWSAAHYKVGLLMIVMSNGGYGVMDALAREAGQPRAWPSLEQLDISTIALGLGCSSVRVEDHDALLRELDKHLPTLGRRREPLLLEVAVRAE
jgi:benzoylformate decarboxylase